jgi:hypothetical protein
LLLPKEEAFASWGKPKSMLAALKRYRRVKRVKSPKMKDFIVSDDSGSSVGVTEESDVQVEYRKSKTSAGSIGNNKSTSEASSNSVTSVSSETKTSPHSVISLALSSRPKLVLYPKEDSIGRLRANAWLTDADISWGLELLRHRYPSIGGLEDTCVMAACSSRCRANQEKNIYVIHVHGNHWLTAFIEGGSNRGQVYDSLSMGRVPPDCQHQIEKVSPGTKLELVQMQQQSNGRDCGLFALAAACDLAEGNEPSGLQYDEESLRSHFIGCIESESICVFPRRNERLQVPVIYLVK